MQCNMFEAKSQLSRLVQAAMAGEDVVIANKGIPVVRLVRIEAGAATRKPGLWADLPKASEDWDSRETNAELAAAMTEGGWL